VNEGLAGGAGHLALVVLFVVAPLTFLAFEREASKTSSRGWVVSSQSLLVPVLVTIAFSIHGFGEGMGYGEAASLESSSSLVGAFGGYAPVASYIFHKVLEPVVIGASYSGFYLSRTSNRQLGLKDLALLGAIFVVPTLIGTAAGYYFPLDSTYLFALGAGASVYVLLRLAQVLYEPPSLFDSYQESLKVVLFALLGFVLIYSAAMFHSVA
jgi:hypothetical protein